MPRPDIERKEQTARVKVGLLGHFDRFTMDDVDKFMRDKFSDLGKTYLDSEPGERSVLLGSIVPFGLVWKYSGLSNQVFSSSYQYILNPKPSDFALGEPPGSRTQNTRLKRAVL